MEKYFKILISLGYTITRTSSGCGGIYSWKRPGPGNTSELVGCICHTNPKEILGEYLGYDEIFRGELDESKKLEIKLINPILFPMEKDY